MTGLGRPCRKTERAHTNYTLTILSDLLHQRRRAMHTGRFTLFYGHSYGEVRVCKMVVLPWPLLDSKSGKATPAATPIFVPLLLSERCLISVMKILLISMTRRMLVCANTGWHGGMLYTGPIIPDSIESAGITECVFTFKETRVPDSAMFHHQTGTVCVSTNSNFRDGL